MTKAQVKERAPADGLFATTEGHQPKKSAKPANPPSGGSSVKPAPAKRQEVAVHDARQNVPAAEERPISLLAIIMQAVKDPACDVAKMRELLNMKREIDAEDARRAFTDDFIALQRVLPIIRPDGKIEIREKDRTTGERTGKVQQATPYATFQNIMHTVKPLLNQHGFALSFPPDVGPEGRLIARGVLKHRGGHVETCAISLPLETSGSKNNVQGVGSSISYGKRYATIALLNIISHAKEDADLDGNDPKNIETKDEVLVLVSKKQAAELVTAIEDCGVPMSTVCTKYGIEKIEDLPASMFGEIISACKKFARAKEAAGGKASS